MSVNGLWSSASSWPNADLPGGPAAVAFSKPVCRPLGAPTKFLLAGWKTGQSSTETVQLSDARVVTLPQVRPKRSARGDQQYMRVKPNRESTPNLGDVG